MTTLVPRAKSGQFMSTKAKALDTTATIKSPLDTFKASGIGERMRKMYSETFYADPATQTGDAVSTLSDEYLMKIYNTVRADNPGANDARMWESTADETSLLGAAMVQAEADPQQQNKETSAIDIPASDIRGSAHAAAIVLSHDTDYGLIQAKLVDAERIRKRGPVQLAWTLDRLYVERDDTGKIVWNTIEQGTKDGKYGPWPIIGSTEKDADGKTVNNPDIVKKYQKGSKKSSNVSFFGEMVRDTPIVRALAEEQEQYLLATAKVPTGKYADQNTPDYCNTTTARDKAQEIKDDIDVMVKNIKKGVNVLRQMWAVNEMAAPNSPPRCVASFRIEEHWDPVEKVYVEDHKKLAEMDQPIIVRDIRSHEYETFKVGEFLAHDPIEAGLKGGTLKNFRESVKAKRKSGSGTGKTDEGKEKEKTVLVVADLDRAIASVATSFETPAANGNYWRFLNGKPEDTDGSLQSVFNIARQVMAGLASQPDLRARLALLEHTTLSDINEQVGLDRVSQASDNATRLKTRHVA